jgi:hypothetical protein
MSVYGPIWHLICIRIYAWRLASRVHSVVFPSPSRQSPEFYLVGHHTATCVPIAKQELGKTLQRKQTLAIGRQFLGNG